MASSPAITRVEPRAARYLELLVEFGHLDERAASEILYEAVELYGALGKPIPIVALQRLAASRLLAWDTPTSGGSDILSADWPLLFH
jgi:hypothetical protein